VPEYGYNSSNNQGSYRSGKTGKNSGNLSGQGYSGKVRENIFLEKSGKMKNW